MPKVDQAETVLGPQLGKLASQAAQVVAATEGAVQKKRKLGGTGFADERVSRDEGHARF
jgi:hypothetical protein